MHERNSPGKVTLRAPRAGELGWIVKAHGEYYARRFGWGEQFEGLVAGIVADYAAKRHDDRQHCWIADSENEPVGCVMLTHDSDGTARLRVMLVIERARNMGVGEMLAARVLATARACGDRTVELWTTDRQLEARRLYDRLGFCMIGSAPNTTFARGAIDEYWRIELDGDGA